MENTKKILFINGSPNKHGNTARLANTMLGGVEYETINLVDYRIYSYGQSFVDDQFEEVVAKIKEAHTVVFGSPLYWHNICGSVRNFLDRCYGPIPQGSLSGRKLVFIFQGAAPEKWMMEAGEYTMNRFAKLYGFEYLGMATDTKSAKMISSKIG